LAPSFSTKLGDQNKKPGIAPPNGHRPARLSASGQKYKRLRRSLRIPADLLIDPALEPPVTW